jgi:hypothetical protein
MIRPNRSSKLRDCSGLLLLRHNLFRDLVVRRSEESLQEEVGLNQRFWSIQRFAFLRTTLSASLQLLQISVDSPFTVVSSSWFPTDFDMRARGNQRASTRLWEQTLIL